MVLEVIIENDDSELPSQDDLIMWRDRYGLTMPVMADDGNAMGQYAAGLESIGLPFTVVLDRGLVIKSAASGVQSDKAAELL